MPPRSYMGFGSFMSDDPEVLIRLADEEYEQPALPFAVDDLFEDVEASSPPELGAAARRLFLIDFAHWTFLNHGAFGASSSASFHVANRWRLHAETQPLRFVDRELFPHLVAATRAGAAALCAQPTDVVLVQNATTALWAVISSAASLAPGDAVLCLNVGYGSVKSMLRAVCDKSGATLVEAELRFPLLNGDSDVVEVVDAALDTLGPRTLKLAVFDAVASNTALVLPVAQLAAVVRRRCPGCLLLVDGAHALGALSPLDVPSLNVDFWVGNCHKHLCSPRGCAILWAAPGARATLLPPVRSHGAGRGFLSDFLWDGNRDYAALLALPATLRWWRAMGPERVTAYMRATLAAGVAVLMARWHTHTLVPLTMTSNMALVRLPADACDVGAPPPAPVGPMTAAGAHTPAEDGAASSDDAKAWQEALYARSVECPVKCIQGHSYVRVTSHCYSHTGDFIVLAEAVAALLGWTVLPAGST